MAFILGNTPVALVPLSSAARYPSNFSTAASMKIAAKLKNLRVICAVPADSKSAFEKE
jgi:hypothetical protein